MHVPLHEDAGAFLQDIVHTNPSIIEFAVFDQVGNEIYTAEEVTAHIAIPSEDITSEDYFIQTIEHKKEYISDPLVSVYNTPYIIWALPIILEDSSVVVIRAIVDLSTLWEAIVLVSEKDVASAHVYIVDGTGKILVSNLALSDEHTVPAGRVMESLQNNPTAFRYIGRRNVEVVGRAEPLPPTNWTIVAEIPIDVLMAETRSNLNLLFALVLIFTGLTLYELLTLRKYLLGPLSEFIRTIQKMSGGNYKSRVHLKTRNELSLLATVMNQMAEQIEIQTSGIIEKLRQTVADLNKSASLLIRRDLELTRANEKLRQLDALKSDFVSLVTHQLRTPLSGVRWSLSMLLNNEMGELSTDQRVYLMKTYESNNRMITLINDMLNADRVESGTLKFKFSPTNLLDLLDNVLLELRPLADKKKTKILLSVAANIPKVLIDAENMRIVLQNLLDNAIKYSQEGTEVHVRISNNDSGVEISVQDHGIGIPLESQANVFKRFFRAENAVRTETDGTGLGLYIVESIIERHHGTIRFESEENMGTTFYVTVPINQPM